LAEITYVHGARHIRIPIHQMAPDELMCIAVHTKRNYFIYNSAE